MTKQDKEMPMSTYDELMQDPEFKKMYKKSYLELVLSELVIAIIQVIPMMDMNYFPWKSLS